MSLSVIKKAITENKMVCPECGKPIKQFEKFVPVLTSAYDGMDSSIGDAESETISKVTLICGNDPCQWRERTEYWRNYLT